MQRIHHWNAVLLLVALTLAGREARAQGTRGNGGEGTSAGPLRSVSGSAYDAATGVPMPHGYACVYPQRGNVSRNRCSRFDGGGNFRIDSLAARRDTLYVVCDSPRWFVEGATTRVPIDLSERDSTGLAVPVPAARCDTRREHAITGEFEGIYTIGFESSSFQPCDGGPQAWVGFAKDSSDARPRRWPQRNDRYYPSFYVRWRGTMTGPGHYGHLGMSSYVLVVHRTVEVRRARKGDCG